MLIELFCTQERQHVPKLNALNFETFMINFYNINDKDIQIVFEISRGAEFLI